MITLKDGRQVHLGRQRPVHTIMGEKTFTTVLADGRVKQSLRFGPYYNNKFKDALPPPASTSWRAKGAPSIARMYLNDQLGDCVIASKYHMLGCTSANESSAVLATDAEVGSEYTGICGPGDNGCVITDVLDYWKATGLTAGGQNYKIDGYAAVDWTNQNLMMVLIDVFGPALCIGINLPGDWTCTNCEWTTPTQGIVGGHDVSILDYDDTDVYISTWAGIVTMKWPVFTAPGGKYIEECYVALVPKWYDQGNLAPNGIEAAALRTDLAALPNTIPPVPGPTPVPVPPPSPPDPVPPAPPSPTGSTIILSQDMQAGTYSIGAVGAHFLQPATVNALLTDLGALPPAIGTAFTIPPFLLAILKLACGFAAVIPPPWGAILTMVCGLLPAKYDELAMDDKSASVVFSADLIARIKAAEPYIGAINHPVAKRLAQRLVDMVKGKAETPPCGCK